MNGTMASLRWGGLALGLVLLGCGGGSAPPAASAGATKSAEVKADAEAKAGAKGLATAVREEVDAAKPAESGGSAGVDPSAVPSGTPLLATVGSVTIPQSAFDDIFDRKVAKYIARGREVPDSARRRYRRSIAERLVYQECLRQKVTELGVEADPVKLAERLEQQKRGIKDWAKHVERRGETEESLRAMAQADLREVAILEHLGKAKVTAAEIEADYAKIKGNWKSDKERLRASHILVGIPEAKPGQDAAALKAEAKKEAERLHGLATAPGADFAELARKHSTGPSAHKGGDLGIFTHDRMVKSFSDAAFALKPGEVSGVVETKFGFHIIKLDGRWPAGELPLEAIEDQIHDRLRQRKVHDGRRELRDQLLAEIPITHHLLTKEELEAAPRRPAESVDVPPAQTDAKRDAKALVK